MRKNPEQDFFAGEFYQMNKEKLTSILQKLFSEERIIPTLFLGSSLPRLQSLRKISQEKKTTSQFT